MEDIAKIAQGRSSKEWENKKWKKVAQHEKHPMQTKKMPKNNAFLFQY